MDKLQQRVGEWGAETFPRATDASIFKHLREELDELRDALFDEGAPHGVAEECADVLLLLLHLAHRGGFSLRAAVEAKFSVCQQREWLPPDEDGVVRHRLKKGDATLDELVELIRESSTTVP